MITNPNVTWKLFLIGHKDNKSGQLDLVIVLENIHKHIFDQSNDFYSTKQEYETFWAILKEDLIFTAYY